MQKVNLDFLDNPYDTSLTPDEEKAFATWKQKYAPKDSGDDYDLRGAFKSGLTPDAKTGHWPDTYKKPNHPTFSDQSIYAKDAPDKAGHWNGDVYVPPAQPDVKVNLDFLDVDPAQVWRDVQAKKYGGGADESGNPIPPTTKPATPIFGTDTEGAIIDPHRFNPVTFGLNPGAAGRAAKTAGSDIAGFAGTMLKGLLGVPEQLLYQLGLSRQNVLGHMAEDFGKQREQQETKAGQEWEQGDYPSAIRRGAVNMLPFGPGANQMLDEGAVDPAVGAGHVAGALLTPKAAAMLGEPIQTIKGAAGALKTGYRSARNAAVDYANSGIEPHMQYFKAIRPKNQPLGAVDAIKGAEPEINRGAEILGKPVTDITSLDEALDAAKRERIHQQKILRGTGAPFQYDTTPVADAIKSKIPQIVRTEQPEVAAAVEQWADETYKDKKMDIETIDELRKGSNAKDAPYWNKLPGGQMNANQTLNSAISKARSDALRQVEYDGLDTTSGTGTGLRQVNIALRDIIKTEEYLDRRYNVELRQAIQNLPQQVSKLLAVGKVGSALKLLKAGSPGAAAIEAATGLGEVGIADFMKELNSTNGQIASAFRRSTAKQTPLTINPVPRYNMALGPATSTVQPQAMTGAASPGSMSAQGQWQQPEAIELPQQTGVTRDTSTGQFRLADTLNLEKFINQEGQRGRLGLTTNRPAAPADEPPVIDAEILKMTPKLEMPASPIESDINAQGQKLLQPGADRITEAPESTFKLGDTKGSTPEFYIDRDPKSGRFRKVYKGTTKDAAGKLPKDAGVFTLEYSDTVSDDSRSRGGGMHTETYDTLAEAVAAAKKIKKTVDNVELYDNDGKQLDLKRLPKDAGVMRVGGDDSNVLKFEKPKTLKDVLEAASGVKSISEDKPMTKGERLDAAHALDNTLTEKEWKDLFGTGSNNMSAEDRVDWIAENAPKDLLRKFIDTEDESPEIADYMNKWKKKVDDYKFDMNPYEKAGGVGKYPGAEIKYDKKSKRWTIYDGDGQEHTSWTTKAHAQEMLNYMRTSDEQDNLNASKPGNEFQDRLNLKNIGKGLNDALSNRELKGKYPTDKEFLGLIDDVLGRDELPPPGDHKIWQLLEDKRVDQANRNVFQKMLADAKKNKTKAPYPNSEKGYAAFQEDSQGYDDEWRDTMTELRKIIWEDLKKGKK